MTFEDPTKKIKATDLQIPGYFSIIQKEMASLVNTISMQQPKIVATTISEKPITGILLNNRILNAAQQVSVSPVYLATTQVLNSQVYKYNTLISGIGEVFSKFDINLKNYADNIKPILRENYWFFTSSMEPSLGTYIIENIDKHPDKKVFLDKAFVDYYSQNNFEELDYMAENWSRMTVIRDRFKILKECVSILKDSKSEHSNIENPHYVIIPTLIAQIDGLMTDYLEKKNFTTDYLNERNGEFKTRIEAYINQNYSTNMSLEAFLLEESNAASDLLLDILFQHAYTSNKMSDLTGPFSRHKIMHGQFLEYGQIEDTIRLFLLIDFLAGSIEEDLHNSP
jgi:hypothetical protein